MNVRLHIDRLVLDGLDVPSGSSTVLAAAVRQELARLISVTGLASMMLGGGAVPTLVAPTIDGSGSPNQLGTAIARAVHASVGRGRR